MRCWPLAISKMPELTIVGFRDKGEMTAVYEEWKLSEGRQLDHVVDTDGPHIGLGGFFRTWEERETVPDQK